VTAGGRSIPDLDVLLKDSAVKLLVTIRGHFKRFTDLATLSVHDASNL
jgi:hypothetical protein